MGKVIDIDKGFDRIMKELRLASHSYVKIGVQAGTKRDPVVGPDGKIKDPNPPAMVVVATANEFGVPGHSPERSFMRSTYDEQRLKLRAIFAAARGQIFMGKMGIKEVLDNVGQFMQDQIIAKINSHPPPDNADSTKARKLSTGTLVDSGQLKQSIRFVTTIKGKA